MIYYIHNWFKKRAMWNLVSKKFSQKTSVKLYIKRNIPIEWRVLTYNLAAFETLLGKEGAGISKNLGAPSPFFSFSEGRKMHPAEPEYLLILEPLTATFLSYRIPRLVLYCIRIRAVHRRLHSCLQMNFSFRTLGLVSNFNLWVVSWMKLFNLIIATLSAIQKHICLQ